MKTSTIFITYPFLYEHWKDSRLSRDFLLLLSEGKKERIEKVWSCLKEQQEKGKAFLVSYEMLADCSNKIIREKGRDQVRVLFFESSLENKRKAVNEYKDQIRKEGITYARYVPDESEIQWIGSDSVKNKEEEQSLTIFQTFQKHNASHGEKEKKTDVVRKEKEEHPMKEAARRQETDDLESASDLKQKAEKGYLYYLKEQMFLEIRTFTKKDWTEPEMISIYLSLLQSSSLEDFLLSVRAGGQMEMELSEKEYECLRKKAVKYYDVVHVVI